MHLSLEMKKVTSRKPNQTKVKQILHKYTIYQYIPRTYNIPSTTHRTQHIQLGHLIRHTPCSTVHAS
ncbi:hypothetical protein EON63_09455 [archaeon]|nr:MAG: hypothetical protein EON63_09455 [archaeon]